MITCKICNKEINSKYENRIYNLLSRHISYRHKNISLLEYYNTHLEIGKKNNNYLPYKILLK